MGCLQLCSGWYSMTHTPSQARQAELSQIACQSGTPGVETTAVHCRIFGALQRDGMPACSDQSGPLADYMPLMPSLHNFMPPNIVELAKANLGHLVTCKSRGWASFPTINALPTIPTVPTIPTITIPALSTTPTHYPFPPTDPCSLASKPIPVPVNTLSHQILKHSHKTMMMINIMAMMEMSVA